MIAFFRALGHLVFYANTQTNGVNKLLLQTTLSLFKSPPKIKTILKESTYLGPGSLIFITITMGMLGMLLVTQLGYQAKELIGSANEIGGPFLQLMIREFGPFVTGMMIATRSTTGIAAEIADMKQQEQIDLMILNNIDPIPQLVHPRMIAGIITLPIITIYATAITITAGMLTAQYLFHVSPDTFINMQFVEPVDLIQGMVKTTLISVYLPIIGCYAGLQAKPHTTGIGQATTRGVVMGLSAVGLIDLGGGLIIFWLAG